VILISSCRKFFPKEQLSVDEPAEESEAATTVPAAAETGAATADPPTTKESDTASSLENKLPEPPKEEPLSSKGEPEAKKLKSTHDIPADDDEDDDWEKVEKESVPHKVTVEDVEDESEKTKA
jgi:hypothetical protein